MQVINRQLYMPPPKPREPYPYGALDTKMVL